MRPCFHRALCAVWRPCVSSKVRGLSAFVGGLPMRLPQRQMSTMDSGATKNTSPGAPSPSSLPRGAPASSHKLMGVVKLGSRNITTEMDTKVPLFLYFTVGNLGDVVEYTQRVAHQVDLANRRLQHAKMGEIYQEFGKDAGLAIKLGIVDCLEEPGLTKKFAVDPHMFPIIYFVRNRMFCDKLVGIVAEAQVKEAIDAFIEYAQQESKNEQEGNATWQKVKRHDNDDENSMTLLSAAHTKLQSKELHRAKELFTKALDAALEEMAEVNQRMGVGNRKMTPEMMAKLKREGAYNVAPQALCGLAMCAMASKDQVEAKRLADRVRMEYPHATKDMRDVAEAIVRIELLILSDFDVETDSYLTLLTYEDLSTNPAAFYQHHLKLAVAHFIEQSPHQAIEECLRLIRAERKLLPALKEAGIVPQDLVLGPTAETPARRMILKVFEAVGHTNEHVIAGRKMLQLYL